MTRLTNRESSLSRKLRHFVYSIVSKILARSRGRVSSVQLLNPNIGELSREHAVAGRDRAFEGARQIAIEGDGAGKRLLDQGLDEFLGAVGFGLFGGRNHLL